ncbi:hypothetical protein AGOR_G00045550 [Albula goreensis]|uniref:DNA-directed RNA polymerase subunit n=1 Tax=Albula goreensis TaxID=1534307 RepID=A0A8T3E796_9TELE|nr:hypothetical protein AGOR_G00045550 [Albula goreensis]
MANLEQVENTPKSEKMSSDVSTVTPDSSRAGPGKAAAGESIAVPCLIPTFADACKLVGTPYSCLVVKAHRRHVALSPMYLRKKKTGIQDQLNAELLKYSESLKGVPLAYDSIKVLGQNGDIYDDNGFIHMNIEASFVVFQPKRGQKLMGVINKVGVSHVGCLVHGCFNASVPRPPQVSLDVWMGAGLHVGSELQFQVAQLDADVAGVLLIRGRLDKQRVQDLAEAGAAKGEELTEEVAEVEKPKKKKKDKSLSLEQLEVSMETEESLVSNSITMDTDADTNMGVTNGSANDGKKKKKKKKREEKEEEKQGSPLELHASDSSGYHSDKSGKKRKKGAEEGMELGNDNSEEPKPKKKKKKDK